MTRYRSSPAVQTKKIGQRRKAFRQCPAKCQLRGALDLNKLRFFSHPTMLVTSIAVVRSDKHEFPSCCERRKVWEGTHGVGHPNPGIEHDLTRKRPQSVEHTGVRGSRRIE